MTTMISSQVTFRMLNLLVAGLWLFAAAGCGSSSEAKEAQLFGESFATSRDSPQDPADLGGKWVGQRLGGDSTVTLNFVVSGRTYTGTFETGLGASGTMAGTISGSAWEGTAIQTQPVGPYEFKLGGMFSPKTLQWQFSGTGFFGEEQASGFANKQ